jgi:hypothetical protein
MTMDTTIGRNGLIARSTSGRAHRIGNFAGRVYFFNCRPDSLNVSLALIGFEELAQILAVAG